MDLKRELQWYPGHMAKAVRQMREQMKLVDLVIEVIDARIPSSARNPELDKIAQGKIRLLIMAKADLADPVQTERWLTYFRSHNLNVAAIDARRKQNMKLVKEQIALLVKEKQERDKKRGIRFRPVRALVVGIPNVGKSTLINSLASRSVAKTGNKPGVTKGQQWIKCPQGYELLDTPGILWPKFTDRTEGMHLALIGTMPDSLKLVSQEEMALAAIEYGLSAWPDKLYEDYLISRDQEPTEYLNKIADRLHAVKSGAVPDTEKAAGILIDRFRKGLMGPVTLEDAPESA